jgi:DDE family transposase
LEVETIVRAKFEQLREALTERQRRLWAASETLAIGRGGLAIVSRATAMSLNTIRSGIADLADPVSLAEMQATRSRRAGGGRKPVTEAQPGLSEALDELIEPTTRGDPMSPLRWTCKSLRQLVSALSELGFSVSTTKVAELLRAQGYSLQALSKTREGSQHPDRDAQFRHIHAQTMAMQKRGLPVVSADCKKKELVGDFKNGGQEWQVAGEPENVRVHDFADKKLGKAIPYGVYDITRNEGWVSVGDSHETAEFAASTLGHWWRKMGRPAYPRASELLVVVDGGGSNGSRNRGWKVELQRLADATNLTIHVSHLPPGTSKWNKIEHRMFSFITQNWRGRPLISHEAIVSLIGSTSTRTGLKINAALDTKHYATGRIVGDEEFAFVSLERDDWHGDWNYIIRPASFRA